MATVSRGLPQRPHLDVPKHAARALLAHWRERQPEALERIQQRHPKFRKLDQAAIAAVTFKLADAQLVIAREYGFARWAELKRRIETNDAAEDLQRAIEANELETVVSLLRANPDLLHVPLRSGTWGPPMSHAANLGRLEIIQAMAALGARDHQHAFERALLQGKIASARWLHAQGAKLAPGIVMGTCETLHAAGFTFLLELGAPLTDDRGNRLAPLALTLETYARNPSGKHTILALLAQHGYELPDTPIMALHRGDLSRLREHHRRDPGLLERRFALRDIYPSPLGCTNDGRSGMHWTPIDGTTLLHLAIDFQEREIFEWLLDQGADVNARASPAADGQEGAPPHLSPFAERKAGETSPYPSVNVGPTPLFHAVVNGTQRDDTMTRALLAHGANKDLRASLRKFLDWREKPGWHEVRDVTAVEWATTFPDQSWVNTDALRLLETR